MTQFNYHKFKNENALPPGPDCERKRCMKLVNRIASICNQREWDSGTPFMLDNPDGSVCYCRCFSSYFPYLTLIKIQGGEGERRIDFIQLGNIVMACGKDLVWKPVKVDFCNGISAVLRMVRIAHTGLFSLTAAEDQLILIKDGTGNKKLVPALALKVGDILFESYSPQREVVVTAITGLTFTEIAYQIGTEEPLDSLDGHLISANFIVVADFAVQVAYISGQLDESWLVSDLDERLCHHPPIE